MVKEYPKSIDTPLYSVASPATGPEEARDAVSEALARWRLPSLPEALAVRDHLMQAFPDDAAPAEFWHRAADSRFRDFFVWGHDHDFGHDVVRTGAMGSRHAEIGADAVRMGFLPQALSGIDVLDIGCWSGGDALLLAGLGARVTAIEEHLRSAQSAERLMGLVGCDAEILPRSIYQDDPDWRQSFDIVYCGGVLYHVSDPVLLLRICFSYLRPGGRLIVETKADTTGMDSTCHYAGTAIKGWNFFTPTATALARWCLDAGFAAGDIRIHTRENGRFLACAAKRAAARLPEPAGFSRPGSWLEGEN